MRLDEGRLDIEHNNTQHNDIHQNATRQKGLICDTQHKRHPA